MNRPDTIFRYAISMLSVVLVFIIVNFVQFSPTAACVDCNFGYGVPFTFFHEGGFAGDAGFLWRGLAADGLVVSVFGISVAEVWKRSSLRRAQEAAKP